nr:MAG TPA: hypothetical protein [Bacteriophage sp.]
MRQNGKNSNLSNLSCLMSLLSHKQPGVKSTDLFSAYVLP